jgi:hypothetical protein
MRVSIGLESTPEEAHAVSSVFSSAGIDVLVERDIPRPSLDVPWILGLTVCPVWLATQFSATLQREFSSVR